VEALRYISQLDEKTTTDPPAASAAAYLKPGLPPFLLVHGDADPKVAYQKDVEFRAKLVALGCAL